MLAVSVVTGSGLLLTAIYALATSRLLLMDFFPSHGITLDWIKMMRLTGGDAPDTAFIAVMVVLSSLYGAVLIVARWWSEHVPRALFVAGPVLFAAGLLVMYPPTAVDLFHYHADARTLWVFGENPLVVPPSETGYFISINWAEQPSPYGPFWSLLTVLLAPLMVFGDHAVLTIVGFKVLAAASYLGCALLVYLIVQRTRLQWALFAFVMFAWNPYVLLRTVGNGHNDLTMMAFALLALLALMHRRWTLVFPLLALSVLIKYTTALLGPPILLYAWFALPGTPRERARALAPGLALGLLVTVAVYAPLWAGAETFVTVRRQTELMITSTPDLLRAQMVLHLDLDDPQSVARVLMITVFLVFAVPLTWQARRGLDYLLATCFNLLFFYLVIASSWFRPWYLLWPAVLIALRPTRWGAALFVTITICNLFPDVIEQYRGEWGLTPEWARAAPVAMQFVLPLAVWLAGAVSTRSLTLDARRLDERVPRSGEGGPVARQVPIEGRA